MRFRNLMAALAIAAFAAPALHAQTDVTPNLSAGVGSFYTDRYTPSSFAITSACGRSNVLQIGVDPSTDASSRPAGQQGTFYNTQGEKTDVNTAGSWLFTSDLCVDAGWSSTNNGYVRTDMWATAVDGTGNPSAYPIIGFTNDGTGGFIGFRGYDVVTGLWNDFSAGVNYGAWNTLGMAFDANTDLFSYYVNGSLVGTTGAPGTGSTGVANVMYQAYNFNDPTLGISNNPAYVADWSNTPQSVVPEPATMTMMATGLVGMVGAGIRKRRKSLST